MWQKSIDLGKSRGEFYPNVGKNAGFGQNTDGSWAVRGVFCGCSLAACCGVCGGRAAVGGG